LRTRILLRLQPQRTQGCRQVENADHESRVGTTGHRRTEIDHAAFDRRCRLEIRRVAVEPVVCVTGRPEMGIEVFRRKRGHVRSVAWGAIFAHIAGIHDEHGCDPVTILKIGQLEFDVHDQPNEFRQSGQRANTKELSASRIVPQVLDRFFV
jgi:hypothetical protein